LDQLTGVSSICTLTYDQFSGGIEHRAPCSFGK
jgi:hypothetical protein